MLSHTVLLEYRAFVSMLVYNAERLFARVLSDDIRIPNGLRNINPGPARGPIPEIYQESFE